MDSSSRKRLVIGILLVAVGIIFLLDNLGYGLSFPRYLLRWPMIFIVLGFINLFSGNPRPAFVFFGLGALFYLHFFDVLNLKDVWPVIIIIIGLSFIFKTRRTSPMNNNELDYFDEVSIFAGSEKKFTSQKLQGGKISSVFGGSEIDLRNSKLAEGAAIEVFCMFGGVEILVPEHWKVNLSTTAIFGGFSDARKAVVSDSDTTLHIKGFVMFGGGEIKN